MSFLSRLKPVPPPPPRPPPAPGAGVHARPPGHGAAPPPGTAGRAPPPEDQQARQDPSGGNGQGLSVDSFDPDRVALFASEGTVTSGLKSPTARARFPHPTCPSRLDPSGTTGGPGLVADLLTDRLRHRDPADGTRPDEAPSPPRRNPPPFF